MEGIYRRRRNPLDPRDQHDPFGIKPLLAARATQEEADLPQAEADEQETRREEEPAAEHMQEKAFVFTPEALKDFQDRRSAMTHFKLNDPRDKQRLTADLCTVLLAVVAKRQQEDEQAEMRILGIDSADTTTDGSLPQQEDLRGRDR